MKSTKEVFRGFFESKLAELILNNQETVPAVTEVSKSILQLIAQNKESLMIAIQLDLESDNKVANDLYGENLFGRLLVGRKETAEEILEDIMAVLIKGDDLAQVMHLHSLFILFLRDSYPLALVI